MYQLAAQGARHNRMHIDSCQPEHAACNTQRPPRLRGRAAGSASKPFTTLSAGMLAGPECAQLAVPAQHELSVASNCRSQQHCACAATTTDDAMPARRALPCGQ